MKKLTTLILAAAFGLGALACTGCNDPCTKAADRTIECKGKDDKKLTEQLKKDRDKSIKECKANADAKKLAKKCAAESDCAKFLECMKGEPKKK